MVKRKQKCSPTPWHVQGHSKHGYSLITDADGETILICLGPCHVQNAELIVARSTRQRKRKH